MLRSKLKVKDVPESEPIDVPAVTHDPTTSEHFTRPFWLRFYDIECELNEQLRPIQWRSEISHVYNPIEYASNLHCSYLEKYLKGPKSVMLVGMNPGPNGMGQTGVPFGNTTTVRIWMGLEGTVSQPDRLHTKRPITGLSCRIEEPSGVRLWTVLQELSGTLNEFSERCFVHNFCPLAFFNAAGQNVTPSELKGNDKKSVREICLKYFEEEIELVRPSVIIAIGNYVNDCLKILAKQSKYEGIQFLKLAHPSRRSLNNNNWEEKARTFFKNYDLLGHLRNQL